MRTIRVDCPYCSMDHPITLISGLQQQYCSNCKENFLVVIDDYGRVTVQRENNFSETPISCHDIFMEQFIANLKKDAWQFMNGYPKSINVVAKKEMGFGWPIYFIGSVNGDHFSNLSEIRHIFDEFHDFIDQNTDSSDILHSFSGLLLFVFSNINQTDNDDECRDLSRKSRWKRIFASAGVFDFTTEKYFSSNTKHGHEWNTLVPPLFNSIDLKKCKAK